MLAEIALSKLSISSVNLQPRSGTGAAPEMTAQDVAAALAGCQKGPYYLGLYKYAGDNSVKKQLQKELYTLVGTDCINAGLWSDLLPNLSDCFVPARFKTLYFLVTLLIDEVVIDNKHKACRGTGLYQYKKCAGCGGTGRRPMSVGAQARRIGVSDYIFKKHWLPIYNKYLSVLREWESDVLSHLYHRL